MLRKSIECSKPRTGSRFQPSGIESAVDFCYPQCRLSWSLNLSDGYDCRCLEISSSSICFVIPMQITSMQDNPWDWRLPLNLLCVSISGQWTNLMSPESCPVPAADGPRPRNKWFHWKEGVRPSIAILSIFNSYSTKVGYRSWAISLITASARSIVRSIWRASGKKWLYSRRFEDSCNCLLKYLNVWIDFVEVWRTFRIDWQILDSTYHNC